MEMGKRKEIYCMLLSIYYLNTTVLNTLLFAERV
jgi:hypothetical protein